MAQLKSTSLRSSRVRRWMSITFTLLINVGLYMIIDGLFTVDVTLLKSGVLS